MKKITFLAALLIGLTSTAQIVADGGFDTTTSFIAGCNGDVPIADDATWRACGAGAASIVDNTVRYPSDKGPNVLQSISLTANTMYRVAFDIKKGGATANTKPFVVTFKDVNDLAVKYDGISNIAGQYAGAGNDGKSFAVNVAEFTTSMVSYEFGFFSGSNTNVIINLIRGKEVTDANADLDVFLDNVSVIEDSSLSVKELSAFNFSIFPNPVKNVLNISAAKTIDKIEIYNVLGKRVLNKEVGLKQGNISVSHLNKGIYIAKVAVGGIIGTYKIVKQ